jgi:hypothetical protein
LKGPRCKRAGRSVRLALVASCLLFLAVAARADEAHDAALRFKNSAEICKDQVRQSGNAAYIHEWQTKEFAYYLAACDESEKSDTRVMSASDCATIRGLVKKLTDSDQQGIGNMKEALIRFERMK